MAAIQHSADGVVCSAYTDGGRLRFTITAKQLNGEPVELHCSSDGLLALAFVIERTLADLGKIAKGWPS